MSKFAATAMESFADIRRRTNELLHSVPKALPKSIPTFSSMKPAIGVRGTWQPIDIPQLPRSCHSIDVISGKAYIFGGDSASNASPVDNAMHLITLPASGAPADYYAVKASAAGRSVFEPPSSRPAVPPVPIIKEPILEETRIDTRMAAESKEKELDDVSLASPPPVAAPEFPQATASDMDRGKEPEVVSREPQGHGEVPRARSGHATAVIGHRIFLFGGRSGPEGFESLDEGGRVWVFDTRSNSWTYLDPEPPQSASASVASPVGLQATHVPQPRVGHAAVATERPRDFAPQRPKRTETWKEWAKGDSDIVGIPQRQIVGNIATMSTDEDLDGYGTFIIHGGELKGKQMTSDVWAFDVRSRIWRQLPPAPGNPRVGASLCISKSCLYRFGGTNGQSAEGGQINFLRLGVDSLDGGQVHREVELASAEKWQTIAQGKSVKFDNEDPALRPLAGHTEWPSARSFAGLQALTTGGGREYLMMVAGQPAGQSEEAGGRLWDDVWAFQAPPLGESLASVTDAVLQAVGRDSGEGTWYRVAMGPYDTDEEAEMPADPGMRGAAATAAYPEENAIVLWGGMSADQRRLGDGWILRLA